MTTAQTIANTLRKLCEKQEDLLRSFRDNQNEHQCMSDEVVFGFQDKISSYLHSGDEIPDKARELLGSAINAMTALSGRPDMDEIDWATLTYKPDPPDNGESAELLQMRGLF